MSEQVNIFWFRRDLRLDDNAGLYHALKKDQPVVPVFIFDTNILDELENRDDRRVIFIYHALQKMQRQLLKTGSSLEVYAGTPIDVFSALLRKHSVTEVFTNHDYEPYATQRDKAIEHLLSEAGVKFSTFKDQVIFDRKEVVKDDESPYTVFTPYSKRWKATLSDFYLKPYATRSYFRNFKKTVPGELPSLESIGFRDSNEKFPPSEWNGAVIRNYADTRDIPSIRGTSRLGVHLRFGTTSIRSLAGEAGGLSEVYLNELIWRDFYQCFLWHFPAVVTHSFKPAYDNIRWRNNEAEFERWKNGTTGYPIVDAGMRELNTTGFMHNRVRMIVASFLTKHLLIDWRWGEAYFAKQLLDYDLAANNGGWQWAAGSGCDAAPYFRVFNPYLQTKRFDPDNKYIMEWVPEFQDPDYPAPIIEHDKARARCLAVYGAALKK